MMGLKRIFFVFALLMSFNSFAKQVVIYVNGIQNTFDQAYSTTERIQNVMDLPANHKDNAKKFAVALVWNPIGFHGIEDGPDLNQDQNELFILKYFEEKFKNELQALQCNFGSTGCKVNYSSAVTLARYANGLAQFFSIDKNPTVLNESPVPIDVDMHGTAEAIEKLAVAVKEAKSSIVIAHSQGNLLANLAFAKLALEFGDDVHKMVKIVNIANTSDVSINDLNFTHASDAALFSSATATLWVDKSLETYPVRKNYLRSTNSCVGVCNFKMGAPTFNAITENIDYPNDGGGVVDNTLNHSIVLTYLNEKYHIQPTAEYAAKVGFTANATRFIDRFEDLVYAAALSLEINQSGACSQTVPGATISDAASFVVDVSGRPDLGDFASPGSGSDQSDQGGSQTGSTGSGEITTVGSGSVSNGSGGRVLLEGSGSSGTGSGGVGGLGGGIGGRGSGLTGAGSICRNAE